MGSHARSCCVKVGSNTQCAHGVVCLRVPVWLPLLLVMVLMLVLLVLVMLLQVMVMAMLLMKALMRWAAQPTVPVLARDARSQRQHR